MKNILVVGLLIALAFTLYQKKSSDPVVTGKMEASPAPSMQKVETKKQATYKVQKGEGLWHVAVKELGSGEKWRDLADANGIKKPYVLYVGQDLKIPGKEIEVVTEDVSNKTYSLAQIAEHDKKEDCWMAIEGKVYDVTPFVASGFHPGKLAILLGCGKDATVLFNTRPMGSGTAHSDKARGNLPKYLIGNLEG